MKSNVLTALLAALLCLSLIACGTAGAANTTYDISHTSGPVIPIEDTFEGQNPEPVSVWDVTENITFSLLQDAYPAGTKQLTMIMENRGDETLTYGEEISFEKYADGEWQAVETIGKYFFHSAAWELPPHTAAAFAINPWFLEKPLSEGLYRVTGGETFTGEAERVRHPAWQLEFRITDDASPEPDYTVFVSGKPLQNPENIPVFAVNTTGEGASILLIPHLEKQGADGQWEEVPYSDHVGFCGMSDPFPAEGMNLAEPAETLWGGLAPGCYRLSFDAADPNGTVGRTAGGVFTIE